MNEHEFLVWKGIGNWLDCPAHLPHSIEQYKEDEGKQDRIEYLVVLVIFIWQVEYADRCHESHDNKVNA